MKKRVLITGTEGFIGSHLAEYLAKMGLSVCGLKYKANVETKTEGSIQFREGDIEDRDGIHRLLEEVRPDYVFHLAAQSLILPSWQNPEKTFRVNVLGTINLMDEITKLGLDPLVIIAGSSAGYASADNILPIKETTSLHADSPYGVSKLVQDMLAELYWKKHQLKTIRIRPFLIIGPRKVGDACSDFARGIAAVESGQKKFISVGNLDSVRDLMDIGDAVKAIWLLAQNGTPGEAYNICSGQGYCMRDVLNKFISLSSVKITVKNNPELMRPSDRPVIIGDNTRLKGLGWQIETPIETSLSNILSYWRTRLREET
ncbi:MAG: GDP-mannose 4,6-dehydratase [Dehalococcoidales bacterium]|nr:GDP-mannose 4,6-dehydratase [Dehalococcoidales bacterium]